MIGAALIIIIPEGIIVVINSFINVKGPDGEAQTKDMEVDSEMLQRSSLFDSEEVSKCIGLCLAGGFILMIIIDKVSHILQNILSSPSSQLYGVLN